MTVKQKSSEGHSKLKQFDDLIIGAGIAGAVFARELTNAGRRCLVLEKRTHIGGNAYTERITGIDVHKYDAHIFHTKSPDVWAYVNRFTNSPVANYQGELYNLPLNYEYVPRHVGRCDAEGSKGKDRGTENGCRHC